MKSATQQSWDNSERKERVVGLFPRNIFEDGGEKGGEMSKPPELSCCAVFAVAAGWKAQAFYPLTHTFQVGRLLSHHVPTLLLVVKFHLSTPHHEKHHGKWEFLRCFDSPTANGCGYITLPLRDSVRLIFATLAFNLCSVCVCVRLSGVLVRPASW